MAKAIVSLNGLTYGFSQLGRYGAGRGSPVQEVHDGDTVIVEAAGNLSVRFLGIDTPEVSFPLPKSKTFTSIGSPGWKTFLNDPFSGAGAFTKPLPPGLIHHLKAVTGDGCATNHADHAERAHKYLEQLVSKDMQVLDENRDAFHFFMAFSHEVMDGYGRFLCFLNRNQRNANIPQKRPDPYNERMLQAGAASPYFIWPNINPFRKSSSLPDAVPTAGNIKNVAEGEGGLGPARQWVRAARAAKTGIFKDGDELRLQPFELRFLARGEPPVRWVIDLSKNGTKTLLRPVNYYTIANPEDRLFVPEEYVPLFVEKGWQKEP